ncbi:alpha/beta hydrolase [Streptomyces sp. NPDC058657]|uniref:alpha/beta hydrolase n=1 Tax=unclassified Streptomyces TaxID=2593676 RepID=UPI003649E30E
MTTFVLVPGEFGGADVWEETAAGLAAAGARARTVSLSRVGSGSGSGSGSGFNFDSGHGPGPGRGSGSGHGSALPAVDLETHIADVVAVVDSVCAEAAAAGTDTPRLVLVGHGYGIHPALAAADRRAEHIARVVYVDAGMPKDGVPPLAAVPDQGLREELAAKDDGDGTVVLDPPTGEEWQRWGSTAGLDGAALTRLTEQAVPQPLATLRRPLRLTGAVASVPSTAVLCTGSGAGIEMVQMIVDLGDPALQSLLDPRVSFFELPTGHWPMLSCPAELAGTLLRAAAGEGHRLKPADAAAPPAHLRPFLLDVPGVPRERAGRVDLYLPEPDAAGGPLPAVLFVHGGPVPAGLAPTPRDWPMYQGYAGLAAARGVVGAMLDHRLHDVGDYPVAADDVAAAVEQLREDPRVDADRIALWFFSGGGPLSAEWLAAPPPWLRCLAATYPILDPMPSWGLSGERFRPVRAVARAGDLPVVLTRAGLEVPAIAATVEAFVAAGEECGARLDLVDVPHGHHGFETLDPTDESREAVRSALEKVVGYLRA